MWLVGPLEMYKLEQICIVGVCRAGLTCGHLPKADILPLTTRKTFTPYDNNVVCITWQLITSLALSHARWVGEQSIARYL